MSRPNRSEDSHRWRTARRMWPGAFVALLALVLTALPTHAQDRSVLVRSLLHGGDFRLRVQAAFAIGNTHDPSMRHPLERALHDPHPGVRAAAATALGRLGARGALPALQKAQHDSSAAVRMQVAHAIRVLLHPPSTAHPAGASPLSHRHGFYPTVAIVPTAQQVAWRHVRYVVMLGDMDNHSGYAGNQLADALRHAVEERLRLMRRVAVFPADGAIADGDASQIRRRHLPKLRVDGNVTRIERHLVRHDISVRCEVSLMLLEEPDRVMRGMLTGAATGTAERHRNRRVQEQHLAQEALAGAVASALSNAYDAFGQAVRR